MFSKNFKSFSIFSEADSSTSTDTAATAATAAILMLLFGSSQNLLISSSIFSLISGDILAYPRRHCSNPLVLAHLQTQDSELVQDPVSLD
ncbi:hypothetical protein WICPIJ_001507 [Wickerhamomyces pijperi]|uniref:Uncharacterized protein n=1 Tax=Wickerhamomyces pijperi TaxID=599730 RepID=A0A9P8TPU1_WICPI|nr:hypothetical protein WICPIJ_001507 [Wickerhamomyces pijperi]